MFEEVVRPELMEQLEELAPFEGIYRGERTYFDPVLRKNYTAYVVDVGRRPHAASVKRVKPIRTDTRTDYTSTSYRVYLEIVHLRRCTSVQLMRSMGLKMNQVSPALGLLKRTGRIESVGKVKSENGAKNLIVWAAVKEGG